MVDSTFGAVAILLLAAVALFFVNPIIALLPLLLVVAIFGLKAGGVLFKHVAPDADPTGTGAATPSSANSAYDPVTNPSDRGV